MAQDFMAHASLAHNFLAHDWLAWYVAGMVRLTEHDGWLSLPWVQDDGTSSERIAIELDLLSICAVFVWSLSLPSLS